MRQWLIGTMQVLQTQCCVVDGKPMSYLDCFWRIFNMDEAGLQRLLDQMGKILHFGKEVPAMPIDVDKTSISLVCWGNYQRCMPPAYIFKGTTIPHNYLSGCKYFRSAMFAKTETHMMDGEVFTEWLKWMSLTMRLRFKLWL